jgi:hypothetical protein
VGKPEIPIEQVWKMFKATWSLEDRCLAALVFNMYNSGQGSGFYTSYAAAPLRAWVDELERRYIAFMRQCYVDMRFDIEFNEADPMDGSDIIDCLDPPEK